MSISDISDLLEKHGFKGALFAVGLLLLVQLFKSEWFKNLASRFFENIVSIFIRKDKRESILSQSDIDNHDIFNYIDFWTYSKIPTFQFSTEYRTVVFRKYLTIYLKSYKKNLSKYVNDGNYLDMNDTTLATSMISLMNSIIYDYEKESKNEEIPSIIIDKMKIKNNETIKLQIDLIEGICSSQFYSSEKNLLKVYSILNTLLSVLESTISSSENVCNSINGALMGMTFDGKKEP